MNAPTPYECGTLVTVNQKILGYYTKYHQRWAKEILEVRGLVGEIYRADTRNLNSDTFGDNSSMPVYYINFTKYNPNLVRNRGDLIISYEKDKGDYRRDLIMDHLFYPHDTIDIYNQQFVIGENVLLSNDLRNWKVGEFKAYFQHEKIFISNIGQYKYCLKLDKNRHLCEQTN